MTSLLDTAAIGNVVGLDSSGLTRCEISPPDEYVIEYAF